MTSGVVTKVVRSFGSEWGRIRIAGSGADCFFNRGSLVHPADFEALTIGQEVSFDDEADMVNGSRAAHMTIDAKRAKRASKR